MRGLELRCLGSTPSILTYQTNPHAPTNKIRLSENMKRKYTRNIKKLRRTQGCMTDCVAYFFNLHPENVPYFVYPREDWAKRLRAFFKRRGLIAIWVKTKTVPKKGMYLVVGDSLVWKTYSHAVIYKNGKCVYDPNYPSNWKDSRVTHYLETSPIKKK